MSAPNWLGLLRWTMSHSDGTGDSSFGQMTAEDKEWLERVMKEAVRDDPQRMSEVVNYLKEQLEKGAIDADEEPTFEANLEDLRDIVEQIDMAQVFVKFGGAEILVDVIVSTFVPHELKALCAAVLSTVAQNNLAAQEVLFQKKTVDRLVEVFLKTNSFTVATKVLMAISSLTRGHAAAEEYFVLNFIDLVVKRSIDSAANNILSRLLFFLNALISSETASEFRIQKIVGLILPQTFNLYSSELSIDARDNLILLYGSIFKNRSSKKALSDELVNQFKDVLHQRKETVGTSTDLDEADVLNEKEKIEELLRRIDQFLTNSADEETSNNRTNATTRSAPVEEATAEPVTVFLIAPPPLEAASNVP